MFTASQNWNTRRERSAFDALSAELHYLGGGGGVGGCAAVTVGVVVVSVAALSLPAGGQAELAPGELEGSDERKWQKEQERKTGGQTGGRTDGQTDRALGRAR